MIANCEPLGATCNCMHRGAYATGDSFCSRCGNRLPPVYYVSASNADATVEPAPAPPMNRHERRKAAAITRRK